MFDNSTLEAYRSVKAPDSLRERVLNMAEEPKVKSGTVISFKTLRTAGLSLAACLVLVMGLWGLGGGGVTVESLPYSAELSLAREITASEVEISVDQRGLCRLSVSCGELSLDGKNTNELVLWGENELTWILPSQYTESPVLTVCRYGKETLYRLIQNADTGEFEICSED